MPINKVLVVDDTLTDRTNLQNILLDAGYQVSVATSGSEALTVARTDQPDLIFLDIVVSKSEENWLTSCCLPRPWLVFTSSINSRENLSILPVS